MIEIVENRYGKSRVRMIKITRTGERHELREWTVQVMLQGDFNSAHTHGDNSRILPTDTMKNTVYSLARRSKSSSMEEFAKELATFLLSRNEQVTDVAIDVESTLWKRLSFEGMPHPDTFMRGSDERQTARHEAWRNGRNTVHSGFKDLTVLKTAHSAFTGFMRDGLTTLQETTDRLLGTAVRAEWLYRHGDIDYDASRHLIRETMLRTFANHRSESVQHSLYAMATAALEAELAIEEIHLSMPNKHCLLVDLSSFGQDNPNEVFVPIDEPHGLIEARVRRTSDHNGVT